MCSVFERHLRMHIPSSTILLFTVPFYKLLFKSNLQIKGGILQKQLVSDLDLVLKL